MKFEAQRESLLDALQDVIGVVEKRQTMPILSHLLFKTEGKRLQITGTDLELGLVTYVEVKIEQEGSATVPARKFFDICRGLPEGAKVKLELQEQKAVLRSGRARFSLATLPAAEYPELETVASGEQIEIEEKALRQLFDRTHFAMAHQDVRYYLNGLLLVVRKNQLRAVATDGHRLAISELDAKVGPDEELQVIVPRKAITELQRLLEESDDKITLTVGSNHLKVEAGPVTFMTKLIDGRFPDYERVIPEEQEQQMTGEREQVRQSLSRAAILSNEKFRGVRLMLDKNRLKLQAQNPDHEVAEDELEVDYDGEALEIGFNVNYLIDALDAMQGESFHLQLSGPDSSGLLREKGSEHSRYVVMPMRL